MLHILMNMKNYHILEDDFDSFGGFEGYQEMKDMNLISMEL